MDWVSVSSPVLPLAGVILGVTGALLGQHMALRVDVRRDASQRAAEQRAERKEAIIGFLSATDRIEQHWERLTAHDASVMDKLPELLHDMWLAKKVIEIVCSGEVAQAAHDYALELNHLTRKWQNTEQSDHEIELRTAFLEAARREMGYTGEPMQRRTLRADHQPSLNDQTLSTEYPP